MFTDHASSGQPTEQRAAGKATRERRAQIEAFYIRESSQLLRLVRRDLRTDFHVAEDACQTAWVALLRREDVPLDAGGLAWMRMVARTTGYRAARGRETSAGSFQSSAGHSETGELPEPAGERGGPLERTLERERYEQRRAQLLSLPARQRQLLGLHGAGLTYEEIAAHTGDSRRTVERQLLRGRARLG
jgi:RNA polymerase sigma factor (sigma-70 family)